MHDLPPTAAAVLGGQVFGEPLCDPASCRGNRRPAIDGQFSGGFPQRAHDPCGRPIHRTIRRDAVDHQIVKGIGLGEFRCQPSGLIHVLGPAPQLLEVLIDATVGDRQGVMRATASVQTPKVVLVDEMVHQVVP